MCIRVYGSFVKNLYATVTYSIFTASSDGRRFVESTIGSITDKECECENEMLNFALDAETTTLSSFSNEEVYVRF